MLSCASHSLVDDEVAQLDRHRADVGERYPSLYRRAPRKRARKGEP